MTVVTLDTFSEEQAGGFYVPQYELKIEGAGLPDDVLRDVVELTYKDNLETLDSFEITVNNWDPAIRKFKYIGSEDQPPNCPQATANRSSSADSENERQLHCLFEPCNKKVQLSMGYAGATTPMMTGNFTTLEPNFPSGGPPTLAVRGLNVLHKLRRKKYEESWGETTDSAIAEDISTKSDRELAPANTRRFPIDIVTDPPNDEPEIPLVTQKNEYDIDFLWRRARERGYVVKIRVDPENGTESLYFGPQDDNSESVSYKLEWLKSIVDLRATITTANQFKSVTVRGWDRQRQEVIEEKVDLMDRELRLQNPDLHYLMEQCDPREEHVVDRPVHTREEAQNMARALLLDHTRELVKINATTVGLPLLRSGAKVEIAGLGARTSGVYVVTETTHTINDSGYLTKFKARRKEAQPATNGGTP